MTQKLDLTVELAKTIMLFGSLKGEKARWGNTPMPDFKLEHCKEVGRVARVIAEACGLDGDKAEIFGLLHDVGCHQDMSAFHEIDGYKRLLELGVDEEHASICLKHTYLNGDLNCGNGKPLLLQDGSINPERTSFPWRNKEDEEIFRNLKNRVYSDYDYIVCLVDKMVSEKLMGFSERMDELAVRYGKDLSQVKYHRQNCERLLLGIETKMGCTMQDLFPELRSGAALESSK